MFTDVMNEELLMIDGGGFYEVWMTVMEIVTVASVVGGVSAGTGNTVLGALAGAGTEYLWGKAFGDSIYQKVTNK